MSKKLGFHIIPVLIVFFEYLSISTSLKIAQTLGDYTAVPVLNGLVRIGDNISYHAVPSILVTLHAIAFVLAVGYFYVVAIQGLGREDAGPQKDRVALWNLDDLD